MSDEEDKEIIDEAKKRFEEAFAWEGTTRTLQIMDIRFGNADSDHPEWQWPDTVYADRTAPGSDQPCLVINKTRQHCLQILNDMRQHEDDVEVRPVSGGASAQSAQILEGICRHISYNSNASQAYDTGCWYQVFGGIGYWRVITECPPDQDTFDQEIYVRRIPRPDLVLLDPHIQEFDGSDAKWAIIFEDVPRKQAEAEGDIDEGEAVTPPLGANTSDWNNGETIRRAEYFYRTEKADELIELPPELAQVIGKSAVRKSTLEKDAIDALPEGLRRRKIVTPEITWCKIVGDKIVDRKPWAGKYIPIVRIIGEETVIDGILDRKGHVRALKDPQRMYNYNSSASVQYGALQSKTQWEAPIEAVEEYLEYWEQANKNPAAILPWKHQDEAGNPIPRPARIDPPMAAPVFIKGMEIAQQELMLASGQYQAIMGAPSNETSGVAINARQRQGDNATGHYLQHRATAIRFTGKILIDLIPKIYDTERVIQIINTDGSRASVQLKPDAPDAHQQLVDPDDQDIDDATIGAIFNPTIGQYDVVADVGPSYATERQEAFNAFSQIIAHNPDAFKILGDLWLEAGDFPGANKAKERIRKLLPPEVTGGPSKEMQGLQQHMQEMAKAGQAQIEELHQALQAAQQKLAQAEEAAKVAEYKAETERMKAVGTIDPEAMRPIIRSMVSDVLGTPIVPVMHAHAMADQARMPQEPAEGGATDGQ